MGTYVPQDRQTEFCLLLMTSQERKEIGNQQRKKTKQKKPVSRKKKQMNLKECFDFCRQRKERRKKKREEMKEKKESIEKEKIGGTDWGKRGIYQSNQITLEKCG